MRGEKGADIHSSFDTQHLILDISIMTYALILGASSGFGAAAAVELARAGMNIIGVHLDRAGTMPAVLAVQEAIGHHGRESHFFNMNAADTEARASVLNQVAALFQERPGAHLRLLMHSLAFGALKPFAATNPKETVS